MLLLQLLINGLALGAAYALVALGFVLIINATNAVNFAQGDLVMAGGFTAVALAAVLPVPGIALLPLVLILMAAFGLFFSLMTYFPLRNRPAVSVFISTIAFGIVLQNSANSLFGPAPRAAPPLFGSGQFELSPIGSSFADRVVIDKQSLAIVVVAAFLIVGMHILLTRTQLGRRLRATAQDPEMARAVGIPTGRMIAFTFALAAALAGAAGLLLANQFFVTPTEGANLMLKAYIATVIGGWGRLNGAFVGALLIALFEVVVSAWISYPVAEGLLYAALLAILFLRPQGLFGESVGRRA